MIRILILAGCLTLLAGGPALAQSRALIDLDTGASLVTNNKALAVGDVVTIIIVEQTTADAATDVGTSAKTEISGGPGLGFLQPLNNWGLDTENKHTGSGNTSRSGNLQGEISARVTEVMSGGLLRLTGQRSVEINGDRQLIEVTGVCRSRDIAADNTILSTFIADARIAYSGTGLLQDAADPGILTRVVNWLF